MTMQQKTSARNYSLDLVRTVAILFVLLLHSSAVFISDNLSPVSNVLNSLSRPAVPLFVMLSGALMLNEAKQREAKTIFRSALQMLGLTILWAVLYSVLFEVIIPLVRSKEIFLYNVIKVAFNGYYHMWYMYMLIGLYACIPFLRCFVKKENKQLIRIFIAIGLLSVFLKPMIAFLSQFFHPLRFISIYLDKFHLDFFAGYVVYFVTGWYIVHIGIHNKKLKYFLYALSVASLVTIILLLQWTGDKDTLHSNSNILVYLYAVGLFTLFNDVSVTAHSLIGRSILFFSKYSFGIYMIHAAIDVIVGQALASLSHPAIHIPLRFIVVLTISTILCVITSKIPIVKKLLRM